MWNQCISSACSQLERQALEDIDKAQKDLTVRVADAREQVMQEIGGEVLVRNRQLEDEIAEQSNQVLYMLGVLTDLNTRMDPHSNRHDLTNKDLILQISRHHISSSLHVCRAAGKVGRQELRAEQGEFGIQAQSHGLGGAPAGCSSTLPCLSKGCPGSGWLESCLTLHSPL